MRDGTSWKESKKVSDGGNFPEFKIRNAAYSINAIIHWQLGLNFDSQIFGNILNIIFVTHTHTHTHTPPHPTPSETSQRYQPKHNYGPCRSYYRGWMVKRIQRWHRWMDGEDTYNGTGSWTVRVILELESCVGDEANPNMAQMGEWWKLFKHS